LQLRDCQVDTEKVWEDDGAPQTANSKAEKQLMDDAFSNYAQACLSEDLSASAGAGGPRIRSDWHSRQQPT
jgi:hypothetical protein